MTHRERSSSTQTLDLAGDRGRGGGEQLELRVDLANAPLEVAAVDLQRVGVVIGSNDKWPRLRERYAERREVVGRQLVVPPNRENAADVACPNAWNAQQRPARRLVHVHREELAMPQGPRHLRV